MNCLGATRECKKLSLAASYDRSDTNQVLVIPFASGLREFHSSAYSDIGNRYLLIHPAYLREFAFRSTLNDTTNLQGLIRLTLLHELGHFAMGVSGAMDYIGRHSSLLGEQKLDAEPEYLTRVKRIEMKADSLAIDLVKGSIASRDMNCYGCSTDIQLLVPGMAFQLFGMRTLEHFGESVKVLRDPSASHPNMELRIAFMNYFLFPDDNKRQMIDDYLYHREVAPIHRQQTDQRIYQGKEKVLEFTDR